MKAEKLGFCQSVAALFAKIVCIFSMLALVAGCSRIGNSADPADIHRSANDSSLAADRPVNWVTDGLIAMHRAAPPVQVAVQVAATESHLLAANFQSLNADGTGANASSAINSANTSLLSTSMMGFVPGSVPVLGLHEQIQGTWLSIDRTSDNIAIMNGSEILGQFSGEGFKNLPAGRFELLLKQRNPLWYAPEKYFTARNEVAPPPGSRERFRRGALGEFVIYLDKDTPLHCGPVWSDELGGARLDENDLSRIYYQVQVGTPVQVK